MSGPVDGVLEILRNSFRKFALYLENWLGHDLTSYFDPFFILLPIKEYLKIALFLIRMTNMKK